MLVVDDLHVSFGGVTALAGVSFVVRPPLITSLIGPNGAGKTTAFNAITGYLRASRGRVTWDGAPLAGRPSDIARRGVVRTFQKTSVFPALSVFENVRTGLHLRGRAGVWSVLAGARRVRAEEARLAETAREILAFVCERYAVDRGRVLLTGMSDGGTYTLLAGLQEGMPFTHLAPACGVLHPALLAGGLARAHDRPIYLVHGALDWMFPVEAARIGRDALLAAGARLVYRELADLSHTYPRDENARILDWLQA